VQIWSYYISNAFIYVILAVSLNLLLGYAGQVSVASAAFAAIGGFLTGYLMLQHWNLIPALLVGTVAAFAVGSLVALPALRLSVEYLILLTLAISSVILGFFTTFNALGGTYGLTSLPASNLFGYHLDNPVDWVLPTLFLAAVTYYICYRIGESPYGRVLKGIREDDRVVASLGKRVLRFKVVAFGVTSGLAGLGGGLLAAFLQLATPGLYGFEISLTIFAMVIFGGMANLTGSVIGAVLLSLLNPLLIRAIGLSADTAGFVQLVAYGGILVVLVMVRPQGLLPEGFSLFRWLRGERGPQQRLEMVQTEGWTPEVSADVADLAVAEHDYLETGTMVAGVGAVPVTNGHNPDVERETLWEGAPAVLEVQGLSKRFGGIVAAQDLNLTLRKGTITALVGPNGAGKTTVFNLLTGFIKPDAGSVLLNGKELVGRAPDYVARMGMVRSFQDVRMFMRLSCLQNVAMAVQGQPGERLGPLFFGTQGAGRGEADTIERARRWLDFVGMGDFAEIPAGSLSYGQSKLLSLARVLATEADVLLLDEPASGIDTHWVDTMLALIESLRSQGRTICIVEHNLHVVGRLADHTYFMELGRITAEGTIDELTSSERLAEVYFGTV
jgi:branched-chain amino acid transport system permease protein